MRASLPLQHVACALAGQPADDLGPSDQRKLAHCLCDIGSSMSAGQPLTAVAQAASEGGAWEVGPRSPDAWWISPLLFLRGIVHHLLQGNAMDSSASSSAPACQLGSQRLQCMGF